LLQWIYNFLGINTLTGILAPLHRFLLLGFGFLLKRQEWLKVWSFGLLINLLLTVCPLVTCVLEKDEAAIESSEFNATSVADVDKRVKRRLLMGNSFLPLSMCCHAACACILDCSSSRPSSISSLYFHFIKNIFVNLWCPLCPPPQSQICTNYT